MKKVFCIALILSFLVGSTTVSHASAVPEVVEIATLEELEAWYGAGGGTCLVAAELVVDRPVVLDKEQVADIGVLSAPIRIAAGGSLTIDGAGTNLQGPGVLAAVEAGGALYLRSGAAYSGLTQGAFVLAEGAVYERSRDFSLSWDVPEEPEPEPEPEPAPITDLWGEVRRVRDGVVTFYMTLPILEMTEIEAIRIQRSADGEAWEEREVFRWNEERGYVDAGPDSRCAMQFGQSGTYLAYVEDTDYQDFYLRLEVEGTPYAGQSNVVKVEIPAYAGSVDTVLPPSSGDYEDNDGNRGGGGQGESDRVDKLEPTPTPTPTPTPETSPEPLPEQESLSVPTPEVSETPISTPEPEPTPSQKVHDVISLTKPERPQAKPPVQSEEQSEPEATPSAPTPTPEVTPTPETTPSPTPQPTPTVEPERPPAKGGGDKIWLAGGLTLILVCGGAVLIFLRRKP